MENKIDPENLLPIPMDFKFSPDLNINLGPSPDEVGYGRSTIEKGIVPPKEKSGFFKTFGAEFYEFNTAVKVLHTGMERLFNPSPYDDQVDPNWNVFSNPNNLENVNQKYLGYLFAASGQRDFDYRKQKVLEEQAHDETLENGSMFSRILGGVAGAVLDPINLIPIAGWVKYAKFAPTVMKSAARAFPGMLAASTIQSAATQIDKVNGNVEDFILDTFISSVVGTTLFGGIGATGLSLDKYELWNLRKLFKSTTKGVDFNFKVDTKGKITGIEAYDATGSAGAAEVSKAQEIADSSFLKSGFFKIPLVGEGLLKLKSFELWGSPQIAMTNSHYKTERAIIDRASDNAFITEGVAKGRAKPKSFELMMRQEFADLRSIAAQMNTLHLVRNGLDIKSRPLQDITKVGLGVYNAGMKMAQKNTGYIARDTFNDEVQRVLYSGTQSEHSAVNEAASIVREKLDGTLKAYNEAYGKSQEIIPPKMAREYLMRVYDINYLNVNKDKFVSAISKYFAESDADISARLGPIKTLESQIAEFEKLHTEAIENLGKKEKKATTKEVGRPKKLLEQKVLVPKEKQLADMKEKLKGMKEALQDELRSKDEYRYHVDDWFALSATEARELKALLSPLNEVDKDITAQQKLVSQLKEKKSRELSKAKTSKTVEKAKPKAEKFVETKTDVEIAEEKLNELKAKKQDIEYDLYQKALNKEVNPNFYYPENLKYKDPNDRLKFREVFESDVHRMNYAKAAYDSIMHTNPEDTIADIMGKVTGNVRENHLKSRTLLVPDELLYNNNFMTKDLMAKVNNYVLYLSRRTNLKNAFNDVTHEGGFAPVIETVNAEYKANRAPWDERKAAIQEELKTFKKEDDEKRFNALQKENSKLDKKINNETKRFNKTTKRLNRAYERMMGLRKRSSEEVVAQGTIRAMTAMANLHWLPLTQIADLGAHGLQHGIWPFVTEGLLPLVTSINGILKTDASEAFREAASHVHLGLQDVLNVSADKNISLETQPYINMGPWVHGAEKMAHFSSNLDLTTYLDNMNQRVAGSIMQSNLMKRLIKFNEGNLSKFEKEYLLKYGIQPEIWADRMVKAYKSSGGKKKILGGYNSKFWQWQDLEAANEFSTAVFRGIQNTVISRGMFDSPFWADNLLGMLYHTFTGWGYASINRYVIPALQRPDAEKMLSTVLSLGFGSLVSPMRRLVRGEDYYPEDMTAGQKFYEAVSDSAVSSALANVLSWANLLSNDKFLGKLKNDRYKQLHGPLDSSAVIGTANRIYGIIEALASGEMNQQDTLKMARMLPLSGSLYGYHLSKLLIENSGLPQTRRQAQALKQ